ncbi:MAG: Ig-like domain-containing protein [Lysobacterales bacterium]
MIKRTDFNFEGPSRAVRAGHVLLALTIIFSMALSPAARAGAFIFAGEGNGVDSIAHPTGYTGTGGTLNVGVCIDPDSANAQDLVIPIRNNIAVWNALQPIANNVQLNQVSGIDAESVLLHEMGHCIGLAHVNAASESGLTNNDYTKATDGANNVFDVNAGPDGIAGSADDTRGDDVNLHWFNPNNDPFELPITTPVDTTTYKRDLSWLPAGDNFAQNASRALANAMGYPSSESVMQQGSYYYETQRDLVSDDAATIMLAESGVDERAGTSDDYQVVLTYEGVTTGSNCGITVIMEDLGGGLAYCSVNGYFINGTDHIRITGASMHLGTGYTYTYNTELRGSDNQAPQAGNDSAGVNEDSSADIAVLGNDSDPDGDPLVVTGVSNPPHGSATVNPDDTVHYAPDANFNGADSFSYTISDGNGGADSAIVNVTVNPVNDYPVAVGDSASTAQDTAVDISVLSNDSDPDGDTLNVSAVTQGGFGSVTNHGSYVTYQPGVGFNGADAFGYTVDDGNGGTDTATVNVTVLAPNQPPIASFSLSCIDAACQFDASASDDPDGTIASYGWTFGDGATGSGVNPSHSYASTGNYTVTLTVTDNAGDSDQASDTASVTVPSAPSLAVADFSTASGSVSGSYQDTWAAGGGVESITESHNGGRPSLRSDSLDHVWQFNLTGGNHVFNVDATADFPSGDADSEFLFEWSTSGSGGWSPMVVVSAATSGYQSFDIGDGVSGTVYVRVTDSDTTSGNTVYSTVSVDQMYFDTPAPVTEAPGMAAAPEPADGAGGVPVTSMLSWSAGLNADSHEVYLGTSAGGLALVSTQSATSFDPPGNLTAGQTYYWRVDEVNTIGTTTGTVWSFTTSNVSGPSELVVDSIVLGTVNAGKGNKSGQAVVTVLDDLGNPVEGVTVSGGFTGSFTETGSAGTGANGVADLTTTTTVKGGVSFGFCVTDLTGGGLPYNGSGDCATY